jgi:bifunctional UDP-N-acetylglucosamine pyrophosphorylase/glucosamine-1-phosphate N-acetyltransferase
MAAGLGTRMKSQKAKVLHELGGRPLISHVVDKALALKPRKTFVVVGYQADAVEAAVRATVQNDELVGFALQPEQRGTGDAVMSARDVLKDVDSTLLILSGDVPLVREETLRKFVEYHTTTAATCSILTVKLENPTGYGRIVRDNQNRFSHIMEQKDASDEEKLIREINSGIYCFDTRKLFEALVQVKPTNQQQEYYLTDAPAILLAAGEKIELFMINDAREVSGINSRAELAEFENLLRRNTIRGLMLNGVTFIDPSRSYISASAQIGHDCVIYPDVTVEGATTIGENSTVHSGTRISNSRIGDNVTIKDHSLIVDSTVESNCSVGPFAHLRMGAHLEEGSTVGNFVEVKKSRLGRKSKSMHLTYLGDATIGSGTNIGAGTVTCNYDGQQKHQTTIGDNVKIGSDTMLVAPVSVGDGAVTAAGSVVTEDVPNDTLVAGVPAKVKKKLKNDGP